MALSFQIESPSVGRGGPPTEIRKSACRVKRLVKRGLRGPYQERKGERL
jgi:hypothetical protein